MSTPCTKTYPINVVFLFVSTSACDTGQTWTSTTLNLLCCSCHYIVLDLIHFHKLWVDVPQCLSDDLKSTTSTIHRIQRETRTLRLLNVNRWRTRYNTRSGHNSTHWLSCSPGEARADPTHLVPCVRAAVSWRGGRAGVCLLDVRLWACVRRHGRLHWNATGIYSGWTFHNLTGLNSSVEWAVWVSFIFSPMFTLRGSGGSGIQPLRYTTLQCPGTLLDCDPLKVLQQTDVPIAFIWDHPTRRWRFDDKQQNDPLDWMTLGNVLKAEVFWTQDARPILRRQMRIKRASQECVRV